MTNKTELPVYRQACAKCIDDLYHVAYLALVDSEEAEALVTKICVSGLHKYGDRETEGEIIRCLAAEVYHLCRRRLWLVTPSVSPLPEKYRVLTKFERLLIAMRYASGLTMEESARIVGMPQGRFSKKIDDILCRISRTAER